MAYYPRPNYVGNALQGLTQQFSQMPVQNAEIANRRTLAELATRRADYDMAKDNAMAPIRDLQVRQAKDEIAKLDRPLSLYDYIPPDSPELEAFTFADQKVGGTPRDEIGRLLKFEHGIDLDDKQGFTRDGKPLPFSERQKYLGIVQRVIGTRTDPVTAAQIQAQKIEHKLNSGLPVSDEEKARLSAFRKMGPKDELKLYETWQQRLLNDQAYAKSRGYEDPYVDNQIKYIEDKIGERREKIKTAEDRAFQRELAGLKSEGKDSDFMSAYKQWATLPGNEGKPALEFKKLWDKTDGGKIGGLSIDQLVDNTRGHYNMQMRAMIDPDTGLVRSKQEAAYAEVLKKYNDDQALIAKGLPPKWFDPNAEINTEPPPDEEPVIAPKSWRDFQ